ncbi:MAG: AAA family ATPase [Thermoplasmataceae archaeon]
MIISVIGSPGTGKTQWIENDLKASNSQNFTYLTYNVSMAKTARERLGTTRDTTGTIHSIISRRLGLSEFLTYADLLKWAKYEGLRLKATSTEMEGSQLDVFSRWYDQTVQSLSKPFQPAHAPLNLLALYDSYEAYKRKLGKYDYTDIIREGSNHVFYSDVLYVDEAQDLSPLMWKIIDSWHADKKVIVGDDDQEINSFRGTDISLFRDHIQNPIILDKSWRFGDNIQEFSKRVIGSARKIPKNYTGVGKTDILRINPQTFLDLEGSKAILCRSNSMAYHIANDLHAACIPIKPETSYGNGWTKRAFKIIDIMRHYPNISPDEFAFIVKHSPANLWKRGTKNRIMHEPTLFTYDLLNAKITHYDIINRMNIKTEEKRAILRMLSGYVPIVYVDTIHASKGLQFDHVMVASDKPAPMQIDDQERRLLYVAVTRASKTLVIHYFGYYSGMYDILRRAI